jgi:hypothetical protein
VLHINTAPDGGNEASASIGSGVTTLEPQDEEVVEGLLNKVLGDHGARLDSIRIETSGSNSFQREVIEKLKDSSLSDALEVRQKSREVTVVVGAVISDSDLVKMICSKVRIVHARCTSGGVTMNPVAFKAEYLGQTWGQVKSQRDAGIKPESLAFFIELQPQ